jgi:hypothetical protein
MMRTDTWVSKSLDRPRAKTNPELTFLQDRSVGAGHP